MSRTFNEAWTSSTQIDDFEFIQVPQESSIELAHIITNELKQRKQKEEDETEYIQVEKMTPPAPVSANEIQMLIQTQIHIYSELKQKYRKMEYEVNVTRYKQCMAELKAKKAFLLQKHNIDANVEDLQQQLTIYQQFAPHILTQVYAKNYADPTFVPSDSKVLAMFEIISRMFVRKMHGMNALRWEMVRRWHDTYDPATLWAIAEVDEVFDYFYNREMVLKKWVVSIEFSFLEAIAKALRYMNMAVEGATGGRIALHNLDWSSVDLPLLQSPW